MNGLLQKKSVPKTNIQSAFPAVGPVNGNCARTVDFFIALSLALLLSTSAPHAATIMVDVSKGGTGTTNQCELSDAIMAASNDMAVDGCVAGSGDDRITF